MATGTVRVPVTQLLSFLKEGVRIAGVSVTPASTEVAIVQPPYTTPTVISSGKFLDSAELHHLLSTNSTKAVLLGGTALFRADGQTHYGVRKLISGIMGVVYESDWLPKPPAPGHKVTPIWLW